MSTENPTQSWQSKASQILSAAIAYVGHHPAKPGAAALPTAAAESAPSQPASATSSAAGAAPLPPCAPDAAATAPVTPPCGPETDAALTAPAKPAPAPAHEGGFHSFLDSIRHLSVDVVTHVLPALEVAGKCAEPEVDLLFPAAGPLFNGVVHAICMAEMAGADAAAGSSKLHLVLNAVGPQLAELAGKKGLSSEAAGPAIVNYVTSIVGLLKGPAVHADAAATDASSATQSAAAPNTSPCGPSATEVATPGPSALRAMADSPMPAQSAPSPSGDAPRRTDGDSPDYLDAVIDLSHWDSNDILAQAAQNGVLGVLHKATEGVGFIDPAYAPRRQSAKGLLWGAYHFGTNDDGAVQAQHFLKTIDFDSANPILLALDVEKNPQGEDITLVQVLDFVREVQKQTGIWPGVYGGYYLRNLLSAPSTPPVDTGVFAQCWLWLAEYADVPHVFAPWKQWTLWQHTDGLAGVPSTGSLPPCDRDFFSGTAEDLTSRWKTGTLLGA